jgi:hypothetical protein
MSVEQRRFSPLAYPASNIMFCGNDDLDWTPYPHPNRTIHHKKLARIPEVRQGLVEVSKILGDVQKLVSERNRGTSFDELWRMAEVPFGSLTAWLQRWPTVSEMERDPVPQVLGLR